MVLQQPPLLKMKSSLLIPHSDRALSCFEGPPGCALENMGKQISKPLHPGLPPKQHRLMTPTNFIIDP